MSASTDEIWIVSADDHVVEPPTLWTDRLPSKYADVAPRVVRDRAVQTSSKGGKMAYRRSSDEGVWADWWLYEDLQIPLTRPSAASGCDHVDFSPITFDEIRPGCWVQADRLADMDANRVEASICFPNTLPRFCGQTFAEAKDHDLALLCVKAYNDWVIDDWCTGAATGRLIPVTIVPLWDRDAAVAEVLRCAAKGSRAMSFSENPSELGLPSIHAADGYWEPLFAACAETETIINMHIGS
ncbi:MAG TPA: amidohydrolase family protein, partial [Ilumatobacteraceae bacterium]|nr:amidohydrolase family protein [Ilumatobacteraceae bacterium]